VGDRFRNTIAITNGLGIEAEEGGAEIGSLRHGSTLPVTVNAGEAAALLAEGSLE
jgi:hypothetical protein